MLKRPIVNPKTYNSIHIVENLCPFHFLSYLLVLSEPALSGCPLSAWNSLAVPRHYDIGTIFFSTSTLLWLVLKNHVDTFLFPQELGHNYFFNCPVDTLPSKTVPWLFLLLIGGHNTLRVVPWLFLLLPGGQISGLACSDQLLTFFTLPFFPIFQDWIKAAIRKGWDLIYRNIDRLSTLN